MPGEQHGVAAVADVCAEPQDAVTIAALGARWMEADAGIWELEDQEATRQQHRPPPARRLVAASQKNPMAVDRRGPHVDRRPAEDDDHPNLEAAGNGTGEIAYFQSVPPPRRS